MTYYDTVPMSNHDQTPKADIFAKDRKIQHTSAHTLQCEAAARSSTPILRLRCTLTAASISWSWSQPCQNHCRASSLPGPQGWPRQIVQDVWTQASESPGVCRFACNMHVWNKETTDTESEREILYIYTTSYAGNSIFLLTSHHLTSPHDFPSVISKKNIKDPQNSEPGRAPQRNVGPIWRVAPNACASTHCVIATLPSWSSNGNPNASIGCQQLHHVRQSSACKMHEHL